MSNSTTTTSSSSLSSVLAALQREHEELLQRLATNNSATTAGPAVIRPTQEKDLQRARNRHDAALQQRQQQVEALAELTQQLMLDAAGNQQRQQQAPAHQCTAVAQLEAELAATARRQQCAASMQLYLQQAQQQHKQELQLVEADVQSLTESLAKAQRQLQEAKDQLLVSKSSRAAARKALTASQQQLARGRATRARFEQRLRQQCLQSADAQLVPWEQVSRLCSAELPAGDGGQHDAQWLQAAQAVLAAGCSAEQPDDGHGSPAQAVAASSACECLSELLVGYSSSECSQLIEGVRAELAAAASLKEAAECCL